MESYTAEQKLQSLTSKYGEYYFVTLPVSIVETYEQGAKTRVKCILDELVQMDVALKKGDEDTMRIYVSKKHLKKLKKDARDLVQVEIFPHPHPLGVDFPEILEVLLEQEPGMKARFEKMTDGRKRSLIFHMMRVKNEDLQIDRAMKFIWGDEG